MRNINFTCSQCKAENFVKLIDCEWDSDFDDDRGMGTCTQSWTTIEKNCDTCNSPLLIQLLQTEYPVGSIGSIRIDSSDGVENVSFS